MIIVGQSRPSCEPEDVKFYYEKPPTYEVIGFVEAFSNVGWTEKETMGYVTAELKKQAAKLGANGVIVYEPGKTRTYWVGGCALGVPYAFPQKEGRMAATAIFVPEE